MSILKDLQNKNASEKAIASGIKKYRTGALLLTGAALGHGATKGVKDFKSGRNSRIQQQQQANNMYKMATMPDEPADQFSLGEVFPTNITKHASAVEYVTDAEREELNTHEAITTAIAMTEDRIGASGYALDTAMHKVASHVKEAMNSGVSLDVAIEAALTGIDLSNELLVKVATDLCAELHTRLSEHQSFTNIKVASCGDVDPSHPLPCSFREAAIAGASLVEERSLLQGIRSSLTD